MKLILSYALLFILAILSPFLSAASLAIPPVDDWSKEASSAADSSKPIMVVFGSDSCSYCTALNQEILIPMLGDGALSQRVQVRKFNVDRGGKVIDFDGDPVRARLFVSRYHVFATPTVILFDRYGNPLGDPIVGYNGVEEYPGLLEQAIQRATGASSLATDTASSLSHLYPE